MGSHRKHKKKQRKTSTSSSSSKGSESGKDAGHFEYKIGQKIKKGQFKITKFLGDGTFGRVLEVKNNGNYYAMKVPNSLIKCIRAVERYIESAKIETKILWFIQERDKDNKYQIVRLQTSFERYGNYFMVFERLGKSLYDMLKKNNYMGFSLKYVQSFARQILTSVGFLHSLKLTHTDLKPENILLTKCDYYSTMVTRDSEQHKVRQPLNDKIKIIDFGGATFSDEYHSTVINTRQYRAPEVILGGLKWDQTSDLWCIGCIILELLTGDLFFQNKEDIEHIAMIERNFGVIPQWMFDRVDSKMKQHFNPDQRYFQINQTHYLWPSNAPTQDSINRVNNMRTISSICSDYPELHSFIMKLMTVEPHKRISCQEALKQPYFSVAYSEMQFIV